MPIIRVQASLQGESGLPEDQFVNVFHFAAPDPVDFEATADQLGTALNSFYAALTSYLPENLTPNEFRAYNLDDPEPREPHFLPATWTPAGVEANALPYEVAACLSYYGFRNIPRQRGRIYLGPLVNAAVSIDPVNGPVASADFRQDVLDAAVLLANDADAVIGAPWVVFSRVQGTARAISNFWMDDALDTQRRRGPAPSSRLTAAVAP